MAQISKLIDIGILVISFGIGFLFFYFFSDFKKAEKKKQLNEIISQLINFIIFIWLGKIILNISLFISDPFAVLAYPSDSNVFYFALIAMVILLLYKKSKKNFIIMPFLQSFIYVFLAGALTFEFIQLTVSENTYAFYPFILYFMLVILLLITRTKLKTIDLMLTLFSIWITGMIILLIVQPFVTIFNYSIDLEFIILIYIGGVVSLLIKRKY